MKIGDIVRYKTGQARYRLIALGPIYATVQHTTSYAVYEHEPVCNLVVVHPSIANLKGQYIIWNPECSKHPKFVYKTLDGAEEAARAMTEKYGDTFYVCYLKSAFAVVEKPVIQRTVVSL